MYFTQLAICSSVFNVVISCESVFGICTCVAVSVAVRGQGLEYDVKFSILSCFPLCLETRSLIELGA